MESRNPIFNKSDTFNGRAVTAPRSSDPSTWQYPTDPDVQEPMTIDSVVSRTAITLGLVIVTAAIAWVVLPDQYVGTAWIGGALIGAGLGIYLSFKRTVSPPLVLLYAVAQGFFLGAASEAFERIYPGIVLQAVAGTLAAFVATLAAYKFFNIQVTDRFRKFVVIAGLGFFVVTFFDFILAQFSADIGVNSLDGGIFSLGFLMSIVGLALGVFFLILDFDMVERGVAAGAPESESWRAAFGLTATLIFIYVELLRILAILRGDG